MSNEFKLITWNSQDNQVNRLPEGFPHAVTPPKYFIGYRCRWIPMTTDWGTIVGQIFAPINTNQSALPQWGWLVLST